MRSTVASPLLRIPAVGDTSQDAEHDQPGARPPGRPELQQRGQAPDQPGAARPARRGRGEHDHGAARQLAPSTTDAGRHGPGAGRPGIGQRGAARPARPGRRARPRGPSTAQDAGHDQRGRVAGRARARQQPVTAQPRRQHGQLREHGPAGASSASIVRRSAGRSPASGGPATDAGTGTG